MMTRTRGERKWRLLLPGASEPRLPELNPSGLQDRSYKPLTRPEQPEHSCRLQLLQWPDIGGYHTEQKRALYTLVDPISPPPKPRNLVPGLGFGGGAGYCPRVR